MKILVGGFHGMLQLSAKRSRPLIGRENTFMNGASGNHLVIIDMQSSCRTWPANGSSRIRAKQKLLKETQRSLQKFLEPDRKPKVIYIDNSMEFGKSL